MTKLEYLLHFFDYDHFPENMQMILSPFNQKAYSMVKNLPCNSERTAKLRKLLEEQDNFLEQEYLRSND